MVTTRVNNFDLLHPCYFATTVLSAPPNDGLMTQVPFEISSIGSDEITQHTCDTKDEDMTLHIAKCT